MMYSKNYLSVKRYERKFVFFQKDRKEIETIIKLNLGGFEEIYEQRFVNNIYFDNYDYSNFFDNIEGVGYNADASNNIFLLLNLGYSHPIYLQIPAGITIETPSNTTILIKGIDKQLVGEIASKIRSYRKQTRLKFYRV